MRTEPMRFESGKSRSYLGVALIIAIAVAMGREVRAEGFSNAAPMATARYWHTATLLGSGKVLVVGGYDDISALDSVELYDPATNTWSAAASLGSGRKNHTATLLPNGKVLAVAGQDSDGNPVNSVELYDPAANTWNAAASLATPRYFHAATLLQSGKVLVMGGDWPSSAELYDPAANSWTTAGNLASSSGGYSTRATLLPNGQVLVAGGADESSVELGTADLYDPATNTWSAAAPLAVARGAHTATLLPNGKVLIAGGQTTESHLSSAELYDPALNSWATAGSLAGARSNHTATLLPGGKVLGAAGTDDNDALDSAELYDPTTNSWAATGSLSAKRFSYTATLLSNGSVLVAAGGSSSVEIYDYVETTTSAVSVSTAFNPSSQNVTLTAVVTSNRGTVNQGAVTFQVKDGANNVGSAVTSAALTDGNASVSYTLPAGTAVKMYTLSAGYSGSATFNGSSDTVKTLTVQTSAPLITGELTATGSVGQSFSHTITATGLGPITFAAQPLPDGLNLSGATISGTPTSAGTTNVTLTANNSAGSDSKTLAITITQIGAPLITSALTATGTAGTAFSYEIFFIGNNPVAVSTSTMPDGLSLSGSIISGTPTQIGTTNVTLTASNTLGSDVKVLKIVINASGAPVINSVLNKTATAGQLFNYTITASGVTPLSFSTVTLPSWLSLSGATLSGTPGETDVGAVEVTLTAANSSGLDTKDLLITVYPGDPDPPSIDEIFIDRNPARTGVPVTFTPDVFSSPILPLILRWRFYFNSVQIGPDEFRDRANPTITKTFDQAGEYRVVLRADNTFYKSFEFVKLSVRLAPNGNEENAANGQQAGNPENGLAVMVPAALGGVVDIDAVDGVVAPVAPRVLDQFTSEILGSGRRDINQQKGALKFQFPKVFVVETRAEPSGRKARMMVPVSEGESGTTASVLDERTKKTMYAYSLSGKFSFAKKDSVKLSGTIELPTGMQLSEPQTLALGIGNITATTALNSKGKALELTYDLLQHKNTIKGKLAARYLVDKSGITKKGNTAMLTLTLSGVGLDMLGFDTEGIVKITDAARIGKPQPRKMQVALVMAGISYYSQLDATYVFKKTGVLTGKKK